MYQSDRQKYEMLARVRDFGRTYGHLFPESSLARQAFTVVANAVAELESRDVAETNASVAARATRKQQARRALRDRLVPLIKTGQALAGADAAFRGQFVLPEPVKDQQLVAIATRCLERAAEMTDQFVAHGMAPTFVSDLKPLIAELDAALRDRGMSRDQLVEARTGIRLALADAFTALWQLDIIVTNHLVSNPVAREVWKRSRRIVYPFRRKQLTPEQSAPTDAPVTEAASIGDSVEGPSLRNGSSLRLATRAA